MSRGLGALQREILETLDAAKDADMFYMGGVHWPIGCGWVSCRGHDVLLPDDIYDLRASQVFLSRRKGYQIHNCHQFQPAFSRAVKTLIARGLLDSLPILPIESYRDDMREKESWFYHYDHQDGKLYFQHQYSQVRFCRRSG